MKITVIGSGCPTCEKLHKMVMKLKEEGKIKAEVEYIKDVNELVTRGVMGSPGKGGKHHQDPLARLRSGGHR